MSFGDWGENDPYGDRIGASWSLVPGFLSTDLKQVLSRGFDPVHVVHVLLYMRMFVCVYLCL